MILDGGVEKRRLHDCQQFVVQGTWRLARIKPLLGPALNDFAQAIAVRRLGHPRIYLTADFKMRLQRRRQVFGQDVVVASQYKGVFERPAKLAYIPMPIATLQFAERLVCDS